jgi:hypothetical protein
MSDDVHACSICGESYRGDGNDAGPVSAGSCCDDCTVRYVIPVRLEEDCALPNAKSDDSNGGDYTEDP